MKKLLFLPILVLASSAHGVILESTVIRSLDGIWPAFDGGTILNMVHLKNTYSKMNLGQLDPKTKERTGLYTFKGKKHSIVSLAEIENTYKDAASQKELQQLLTTIKNDFIKLNERFIKQVQTFKDMVVTLMRESCAKHNMLNSFMLTWAETQAGKETDSFNKNMTSFTKLNVFLNDLCNFLQDLYDSCPKGRAQFRDILRKQKNNQAE